MFGSYLDISVSLLLCIRLCSAEFSNEWVVEIHAPKEMVINVIKRHGFTYISQVGNDLFSIKHSGVLRRSKHRSNNVYKQMKTEKLVSSLNQQKWNQRYLRNEHVFTVQDSQWTNMWHLNGDVTPNLEAFQSWSEGYNGQGINVAVVDDGVDIDHADLNPNYNMALSIDVQERDNDPRPSLGDEHGTKCAGIALAAKNTLCVLGVAFNASLVAVRLLGSTHLTTDTMERDALLIDSVDIFSNSWGVQERTTFEGPGPYTQAALEQGTRTGRGGLGSIYVWAAGNGGSNDNCNCDGYANSIYTIGISSVTDKLAPPTYAEPCTAVLACTFSGGGPNSNNIYTTDVNQGCTNTFIGTSASTPMAAGIFALVLQANRNLTWRDIQHILVNTSDPTGLQYGQFETNGAGNKVSDLYGFGLIKSAGMIAVGKTWKGVPKQHRCISNKIDAYKRISASAPTRVVESTWYSDGCNSTEHAVGYIEHVQVEISFTFTVRGAVKLLLTAPSNHTSHLLTRRSLDVKNNSRQVWKFMTVQHWGEWPTGEWKLEMNLDQDWQESGELEFWTMTIYGTELHPSVGRENETTDLTSTPTSQLTNQKDSVTTYVIVGIISGFICATLIVTVICVKYNVKSCKVGHSDDKSIVVVT